MYKGFNKLTGFTYEDPTPRSCGFRLIMLESIAGCPGMVAAVLRHFTSLRLLRRDHGWIHTLLEVGSDLQGGWIRGSVSVGRK